MAKIDINDKRWYCPGVWIERTKKRLQRIINAGMEEVGTAQFGIPNIIGGLYIEIVWNRSDDFFNEYMDWAEELIKEKTKNL